MKQHAIQVERTDRGRQQLGVLVYRNRGKLVWTNPGSEKNKHWHSYYMDVIAIDAPGDDNAYRMRGAGDHGKAQRQGTARRPSP
jgi:hypothetical protein